MRTLVTRRAAWVLTAFFLSWGSGLARPSPSEPASTPEFLVPLTSPAPSPLPVLDSPNDDPEDFLQRALDFERQRNWQSAIEVYEKALEQWPSRVEFTHRRRLCESHYRLVRRYQDQSFRNVLLKLPRERAYALYEELLERIETHYVDPVPLEPLIRRGLDNMEVALRDPGFLATNAAGTTLERVNQVRDVYRRQRSRLNVPTLAFASAEVRAACDAARQGIGLSDTAVILEFTYGACDALDDYSSYLSPDKLDDLYSMIDGNFVGLGIELKQDPEGLRIVGVLKGGPASDAGLRAGDVIAQIGGAAVKGLSLDVAANKLQGAEGSLVDVTIRHANGASQSYRMARRHVEVESVANVKMVDPAGGVGYVQLTGFQKSSTEELDKAIALLTRQGMRTLVLDLRGNPGGLLNIAVEIAERFVDQGVIVSTQGRAPGQSQVYRAASRAVWKMPLYVLIDHDSASASEILAGALKEHHRAVVLGERSYGKGSVQSIFALRSAPAGLKLTTAKFYSPDRKPYSENGVEPDIQVRTAARPPSSGTSSNNAFEPPQHGDPETDPVLSLALRHALGRAKAAR